jgi:hypothetical protein
LATSCLSRDSTHPFEFPEPALPAAGHRRVHLEVPLVRAEEPERLEQRAPSSSTGGNPLARGVADLDLLFNDPQGGLFTIQNQHLDAVPSVGRQHLLWLLYISAKSGIQHIYSSSLKNLQNSPTVHSTENS